MSQLSRKERKGATKKSGKVSLYEGRVLARDKGEMW